jgi:hypothetical protein
MPIMKNTTSKGLVMEENIKLMNKNVNDLTVGDALKINGAILAVMVAVPLTITAASAAKEKFTVWNTNRKLNKSENNEK